MTNDPYILEVGSDHVNPLAALTFIKREVPTMIPFRLRPYERVMKVRIERDRSRASVLIETFIVRETRSRTTFIKRGRKLIGYTRHTSGQYYTQDPEPIIVWDDDFAPTDTAHYGRVESVAERAERREWEADAHRVGSSKNPLDNASRTADQFAHPTMTRYWSK